MKWQNFTPRRSEYLIVSVDQFVSRIHSYLKRSEHLPQEIREQYADTGGFTDHIFAVKALLDYRFIPCIRDLPSKRLYVFDPCMVPKELKSLIGGKVRQSTIIAN